MKLNVLLQAGMASLPILASVVGGAQAEDKAKVFLSMS